MRRVETVKLSQRTITSDAFSLFGSEATVAVADRRDLDGALVRVRRIVASFDQACSSFREDSELTLLNGSDGEPVVVSPLLLMAVRVALRAARLTSGAVDPTVGQALITLGFNPRVSVGTTPRIGRVPGYEVVNLDLVSSCVQLPPGVSLDLSVTAKALAADMGARAAAQAAGCGVLVSLGGDVATAGDPPAGGWRVRVVDDHRHSEAPGQTVRITGGGLATSSVTARRRGSVHHLINPKTGLPTAGPWRTTSVVAGSCLAANTASTAAIVLGIPAAKWLQKLSFPARLIGIDRRTHHIGGWPAEGDEL